MTTSLPLRCKCGKFTGELKDVSPQVGNRVVCMCDDCQCYATHLGKAGELLDEYGGTDIFQLTPAQVKFHSGTEHVMCTRLSPKGLMRWHTSCCQTPIANTMASEKFPFAGIPHLIVDHQADGRSRDQVMGPIRAKIHGRFSKTGQIPAGGHKTAPLGIIMRTIRMLFTEWLRGKNRPSPFFAGASPVVTPTVLSREERDKLRREIKAE